jgi:hypothetical protein
MKKHLFGFAIFSLIVGSAILVSSMFSSPRGVFVPVVETVSYDSTQNSCWKMKRKSFEVRETEAVKISKPFVRQAVLDLNTKQLDWDLVVPESATSVALHFFAKDARGVRHLKTEFVPILSVDKPSANGGVLEFTSSYLWLDKLGYYENLYVVPEAISRGELKRRSISPVFDETAATSVLLYTGQAGYPTEKYFRK